MPSAVLRLLSWIVPAPCLGCDAETDEHRPQLGLCAACRGRLRPWDGGCAVCGQELAAVDLPDGHRCSGCRDDPPPFSALVSAWAYAPPLDAVVSGLKFRRLDYLARGLAEGAVELCGRSLPPVDVVAPVPLHWARRWRRGYDQAERVAEVAARALDLPHERLLRRRRRTPPQSRAVRRVRRRNLAGAFGSRGRSCGRRVLLVDDVVTTGATLRAAAATLRAAGAADVVAFTMARTPLEL